ncbi:hypothetical protein, partial [Thermomonas sp.]|uniref:hypothetical protein n=1 Tax=Thermomonas sp. TaxID=1971895 RepID=UPI00248A39E6
MSKYLWVLFFFLLLVMIGFGMTLPVFAIYTERLAIEGGASRGVVAGLLYGFTVDGMAGRVRKLLVAISGPPTQAHQEAQGA